MVSKIALQFWSSNMNITERQMEILDGVCKEYIKQAFPISSQFLKERQSLPYSSATIRNEFVALEDKSYLLHPYVSSGRIPSDKGYRFFVERILKEEKFECEKEDDLEEFFSEISQIKDILKMSREITKSFSELSSNLVLTYLPQDNIFWREGWDRVIDEPEFQNVEYLKDFLESVRDFEKNIEKLDWEREQDVKVYIGRENPFLKNKASVIVAKVSLQKDIETFVAILGPKRMDFERNIGFLKKAAEILESF